MPYSLSDSDDDRIPRGKPFGRQRPIYDILGGGQVADVLLWKDRRVSAAILVAVSTIWFLFEVIQYNFLTLLCHVVICTMIVIFVWEKGADTFNWPPPRIPYPISDASTFRDITAIFRAKSDQFLSHFLYVACGNDFRQLVLAIGSLWILSIIGNYISTVNLLFFGCLCLETLPYLYNRYEEEVEYFLGQANRRMEKSYKKFDKAVLRKIPRGPVKEMKHK